MGIAAVGNNLITYVINEMHFPLSKAANIVTNFVGTIFIFGLLGGYLSDAFLGSFWTILIFGFVELSVCLCSPSIYFIKVYIDNRSMSSHGVHFETNMGPYYMCIYIYIYDRTIYVYASMHAFGDLYHNFIINSRIFHCYKERAFNIIS